jgi:beta-fructofuranosidase
MGFLHTAGGKTFVGEVSDPIPVRVDAGGLLHTDPEEVPAASYA